MPSRRLRILTVAVVVMLSCAVLWAAKEFIPPHAENANTYAAKDAHPEDKVTVAIDLYDSAPKNDIFITPFDQEGILPVFLIVSNDGDHPIALTNMRAQVVTEDRAKLEALSLDDVFRRVGHISGSTTPPPRLGPIPLSGNKNKKAQKQYQEIQNARFAAEAVEPHTTKAGFVFFDIAGVRNPVSGSHLYLTGVQDAGGTELIYFDVPLIASNAAGSH